jgi:hypothetical protein
MRYLSLSRFFVIEKVFFNFFSLSFVPEIIRGALIKRAEIKPIEPVRVMPERENEKFVSF